MEHTEVVEIAKQAIESLIKLMVDTPEQVRVEVIPVSPTVTVFTVYTANAEAGGAIGKQGAIANAIRTLLHSIGARHGHFCKYEVAGGFTDRTRA